MKLIHNSEELQIKSRLPVVPLRDVVVFPHMIYPLLVGRKVTINALQEAMIKDKQLLLVARVALLSALFPLAFGLLSFLF